MEGKKRELAPWLEKINEKQSAIDVAQSEYKLLKEKIDLIKQDLKQAEIDVASLQEKRQTKVISWYYPDVITI